MLGYSVLGLKNRLFVGWFLSPLVFVFSIGHREFLVKYWMSRILCLQGT